MPAPRSHTVRVGDVVLWKDACLRGTGFPARTLLALAAEDSTRMIDAALADERGGGPPIAELRTAIEAAFAADWARVGERMREVVRAPRFREAVLWQNRRAVHTGLDALLRRPASTMDAKTREYERMVASYLQRYCAKNETIGFFGPLGWATLDADAVASRVAPGRALLERRTVYFEHWAIDALAERLSEDRTLRICVAPRRMPTVWLDGDVLHFPIERTTRLPPVAVRLIQACDGEQPAYAIAETLVAEPELELESPDEVYDLLDELVENRILRWRLEVPTAGFVPEQGLRDAFAAIYEGPERAAAEAALAELEAARDGVAAAAGDPAALDGALAALEETFVRLTDKEAARGAGKTYVGRGLVFEDCRRDVEVVLGRPFLERIAPPLALLRASARWFTHTIAARFGRIFDGVYRTLAAATGSPDVDFIRYYQELGGHLTGQIGAQSPTVLDVERELQSRWADVLALPQGERRVELRAADLAPRVAAAFAAPGPGWASARHHSPDLLIAAAGPAALARGDYLVVLGELHTGVVSVTVPVLAKEHADPARLHEARFAEAGRTIGRVEPRASIHRGRFYSLAAGDLDIEFGDARSHRPRSHVFDVAGFVVTERAGQLVARHRDGAHEFPLVAFLEGDLHAESYNFDIFGAAAYRPRITVDNFVLARERWRFDAAHLPFARGKRPLDRFIGARRWAAEHGLPRCSFVKSPSEPKPIYLDLESPILVEIFCKLIRTGGALALTEMLPTFEQLWLVDADGEAYCSELRIAMVDDAVWTPPHIE